MGTNYFKKNNKNRKENNNIRSIHQSSKATKRSIHQSSKATK